MSRNVKRNPLDRYEYALGKAVEELLNRVLQHERMELTYEEMLDFLVPPEHHSALMGLAGVIRQDRYGGGYNVQLLRSGSSTDYAITLEANIWGERPAPPYVGNRWLYARHDSEVGLRLAAWADRRIELGLEFARARWLIGQLNSVCGSIAQVKYYWPSIRTLCGVRGDLNPLADALDAAGKPSSPPPLDIAVRKACQVAAGTITAASLLDDKELPDAREVRVGISIPYNMHAQDHITGKHLVPL